MNERFIFFFNTRSVIKGIPYEDVTRAAAKSSSDVFSLDVAAAMV